MGKLQLQLCVKGIPTFTALSLIKIHSYSLNAIEDV